MPLTALGRALLGLVPGAVPLAPAGVMGCQVVRHEALCNGCGLCVSACPAQAMTRAVTLDVGQLYESAPGGPRGALAQALRRVARHAPDAVV